MDRRHFIRNLSSILALAAHPTFLSSTTIRRPNILLITADDLNYDSVGIYGCQIPGITPNIDSLAREGMRFTNAHVNIAVCQPCRSALMTGRFPHRNGSMGFEPILENVPTLQEQMREAGYFIGIIGKVYHLTPEKKFCWDRIIRDKNLGLGRDPSLFSIHAKSFFEEAKKADKPFFLMVNSSDSHRPFAGSVQEKRHAAKRNLIYPKASHYYQPEDIEVPGFLPDLPDIRTELAQYFTSVHRCDEMVGKILKALEGSGMATQTMVFFLSDNGMAFPFAKTNCYLSSTKTPWIVRWPGVVKPGKVDSDHLISTVDFMPTVLEAVGLPRVDGMDGSSCMNLLKGHADPEHKKVHTTFYETSAKRKYPMRCLQTKKFGYIYNDWSDGKTVFINESQNGLSFKAMKQAAQTNKEIADRVRLFQYRVPEEFYDFAEDPNALHNLINNPAYSNEIERMRIDLLNFMISIKDPLAENFESYLRGLTQRIHRNNEYFLFKGLKGK